MELLQLKYFLTVARLEHMTHAADELGIAQPPLSQTIARPEEELGVPYLIVWDETFKGLNNRAENSHQPTRLREKKMRRFTSARTGPTLSLRRSRPSLGISVVVRW